MPVVASKTILSRDQMMRNSPRFSKLRVENLEGRTLLTVMAVGIEQATGLVAPTEAQTWIVNTLEDPTEWDTADEVMSLREALDSVSKDDKIIFDDSLAGGTITLNGSQLEVFRRITIDASSVGGITIDAGGKSRVFEITGGDGIKPVELISLTITGGYTFYDIGGGICCHDGILTMTSCTVSGNVSILEGGGICNFDGTLTLADSIVSENSAVGGAGISNQSGTLTLIRSTVSGNAGYGSDGGYGGGIHNEFGTVTMMDCTVSENTAFSGAGIYNNYSTLTLTNSTVYGNIANGYGGGIYNNHSTLTLTDSTVSGNTAKHDGGGIYNRGTSFIYNTIIALNTAVTSGNDVDSGLDSLYGYNVLSSFTDWTESEHCLLYDSERPLFRDAENGNFTLAKNSQAIDDGNNDYVTAETDLAGNPRIVNGIVDLGAYEYQGASPAEQLASPTILTGNRDVYVSYGANRHQILWNGFENVSGYELQYSADGSGWTTVSVSGTSAIVTGLTYGQDVKYRVRALGDGVSYTDSDWSAVKVFKVCPMDINNDGDISGGDRALLGNSWLSGEGDDEFLYAADIDGDGDVSSGDRVFLSNNWLMDPEEEGLLYPASLAAEAIFTEIASADIGEDLNVF